MDKKQTQTDELQTIGLFSARIGETTAHCGERKNEAETAEEAALDAQTGSQRAPGEESSGKGFTDKTAETAASATDPTRSRERR